MFDDYWCKKWIAAHMKLQANKLLTLFGVQLTGGITLNIGPLVEEANKDIELCTEHFKDCNTMSKMWTIA